MSRRACSTCPWRKRTRKRGFPGGYVDVVRLARAVTGEGPAMACHAIEPLKVCVGFAVQVGERSESYRRAQARGDVDAVEGCKNALLSLRELVSKHAGRCNGASDADVRAALETLFPLEA